MSKYPSIKDATVSALNDEIKNLKIERIETPFVDDHDNPLPINLVVGNFSIVDDELVYRIEVQTDENGMSFLIIFPFLFREEWRHQIQAILNELSYDTMEGTLSHKGFDTTQIYYKVGINLKGIDLSVTDDGKKDYKPYYMLLKNKLEATQSNIKEWHVNFRDYVDQKISANEFIKRLGDW